MARGNGKIWLHMPKIFSHILKMIEALLNFMSSINNKNGTESAYQIITVSSSWYQTSKIPQQSKETNSLTLLKLLQERINKVSRSLHGFGFSKVTSLY
jgi:hypothetical protein